MFSELKSYIIIFIKGCFIGVANIIPGVSGGTMAVVVGVYERLIDYLNRVISRKGLNRDTIIFLGLILAGSITSIFLLSNFILFLLKYHYSFFMFFLMGLIIGSIPSVVRMNEDRKIDLVRIIVLLAAAGIAVILAQTVSTQTGSGILREFNLRTLIFLFITGFFAGGAMIIPGISGSLIMVILGQYETVIFSLKNLLFFPLLFLISGIAGGVIIFAKLIKVLFSRVRTLFLYFIIGLILGSCYKIYPGFSNERYLLALNISFFLAGSCISFLFNRKRHKVKSIGKV